MHDDPEFVPLKINAVIPHAKAMQRSPAAFELAEFIEVGAHHLLGQTAKFAEDLQLQVLGHPPQFGGAGRR